MQGENRKLGFSNDDERTFHVERKKAFFTHLSETRTANIKQLESWQSMFPQMFDAVNLPSVNERSAQRIATVFGCLNILGETVGSLPFSAMVVGKNGPEANSKSNVHRLIHDRPNANTTAFDFWSTIEKLKKAWGNAYAEIVRDSNYEPIALNICEPWEVTMKEANEEIYFKYEGRIIRSTDMLHFKNYSFNGECGVSTIRQNALTIGLSLKLNTYNASIIGERPYGYLTSEKKPKDLEQKGNIRSMWDKRSTSDDEGKTVGTIGGIPYLYGGLEFKSFTLPADDVAYIESAKLTDKDIYGIFRIPPTFMQDWVKAPYNSSEQQDIAFVKYTLASLRAIEQECTEKLFPESNKVTKKEFCKFELKGILRGDSAARREFYNTLFNLSAITANQICELEDMPTFGPSGDVHYVQGALVPVDLLADFIKSKSAPAQQTQSREQIMSELREKMKTKLNGHFADIAEFLN